MSTHGYILHKGIKTDDPAELHQPFPRDSRDFLGTYTLTAELTSCITNNSKPEYYEYSRKRLAPSSHRLDRIP